MLRKGRICAILDAKYRDIWNKSLPRDMLYQLAIYALSQGYSGRATILYPAVDSEASPEVIEIRKPFDGSSNALIVLRPVNLLYLCELIEMSGKEGHERRATYAQRLAFGHDLSNL